MTASMAGLCRRGRLREGRRHTLPLGQVLLTIGLTGMLVFAAMAARAGESRPAPRLPVPRHADPLRVRDHRAALLRPCDHPDGAVHHLRDPAGDPLVVVAGAALVFGEKVSLQRWLAVLVGFVGVLVILRPGSDFSALSLLAVVGLPGLCGPGPCDPRGAEGVVEPAARALGFAMLATAGAILLVVNGGARMCLRALALMPIWRGERSSGCWATTR